MRWIRTFFFLRQLSKYPSLKKKSPSCRFWDTALRIFSAAFDKRSLSPYTRLGWRSMVRRGASATKERNPWDYSRISVKPINYSRSPRAKELSKRHFREEAEHFLDTQCVGITIFSIKFNWSLPFAQYVWHVETPFLNTPAAKFIWTFSRICQSVRWIGSKVWREKLQHLPCTAFGRFWQQRICVFLKNKSHPDFMKSF